MKLSLPKKDIVLYIENLINSNFSDGIEINSSQLESMIDEGLKRTESCFKNVECKYYNEHEIINFNHLNSDHMAVLLYFSANSGYQFKYEKNLLEKFFYLNKIMNGVDMFYSVILPKVFFVVHPLGSVFGNAKYGNYMSFYQNVTIGSTEDGSYPSFGKGIVLFGNCSVIGNCKIGNNVLFAANSFIINKNVPDNSTVLGVYPNNKIIENNDNIINRFFKRIK
tara:strand:- start:4956 stop:5624 length:669 start_codon:yes stop_codon:yes gene_type:complete